MPLQHAGTCLRNVRPQVPSLFLAPVCVRLCGTPFSQCDLECTTSDDALFRCVAIWQQHLPESAACKELNIVLPGVSKP